MKLRSARGWPGVAAALGLDPDAPPAVDGILAACLRRLPAPVTVEVLDRPSRARPAARGRYAAGLVTLFPAAFADPEVLAHTLLHELAHARGADEAEAEAVATALLREADEPAADHREAGPPRSGRATEGTGEEADGEPAASRRALTAR